MRTRKFTTIVGLISIVAIMGLASSALATSHSIELISSDATGSQGNNDSTSPSTSSDGRYVAFVSSASDLVTPDANGFGDIFLKDNQTGVITLVSTSSADVQGNGESSSPSISADGRYVAFQSFAANLLPQPVVNKSFGLSLSRIFVKDTETGTLTEISTNFSGTSSFGSSSGPAISADGRHVAFWSAAPDLVTPDANIASDVFVRDTQTGITTRVSTTSSGAEANGDSQAPSISADGRYVAFQSDATNFLPFDPARLRAGGDSNNMRDVFVKDTQTGAITRVSTDSAETQSDGSSYEPSISSTGRYVAFHSGAANLITGDTNLSYDIFVKDTETGATTRESLHTSGAEGNNNSESPSISADGRYVSYESYATNLDVVPESTAITPFPNVEISQVYVTDTTTGRTERISESDAGIPGNLDSDEPSISANGRYVAFDSDAVGLTSLVGVSKNGVDTNNSTDVFRTLNPTWAPPVVTLWPRANELPFGMWSKLAGTVVDGSGDPVANQKVWLQYLDGALNSLSPQGVGTWEWLANVTTDSNGYYQLWFYYEGGTRYYRAKEAQYDQISNTTQIAFTKNISAWNTYRPTVKYCQWTKIHGKYGGPNGLYKNTTLYLQRMNGNTPVWQATVQTDSSGYYAAWAPICPTTQLRMGTAGSAVTSAVVTKTGSTINAWQNSKVHAVLKDGFGAGVPGISLYLQKWNGSAWTWQATCSTSSTGYCNFGSVNPSGDVRVANWGSRIVSGTM